MAMILQRFRAARATDLFVQSAVLLFAGVAAAIVVIIGVYLFLESAPLLTGTGIPGFFLDRRWYPLEGEFGMAAMLAGTLSVTALAMLLAAPVGIAAAVFMRYYAPPAFASFYRRLLELLSGIPSVVFGFWGLIVLVPLIAKLDGPGASVLAGGLVLGLMILPLVSLSTDSSLAQVPRSHWLAGTALGLGRWAIVRKVMIPSAASGILAGMVLQTGRALGETMAVLMVTGNVVQLPASVFEPVRALTSNIALEMAYATGDHRTALFVSGLILLVMTAGLVAVAAVIQRRLKRYG
jgi:phosphate transport system permease protein